MTNSDTADFIHVLREKLSGHLPGNEAHQAILSYPRPLPAEARLMSPPARESAVMMLLYRRSGEWYTSFMKRTEDNSAHSGQISFPGGKQEADETFRQTAVRETQEEFGIRPEEVEIIGQLTELYIPPSHFIVHPFVGLLSRTDSFVPNHAEVIKIIEQPISVFLREKCIHNRKIYMPKYNSSIGVSCFDLQGEILWGATAMIVQEFRSLFGYTS